VPVSPNAMLVGKGGGANDGDGHFCCRKAAWALIGYRRSAGQGEAGPDEFLKFR
jgi:hypothetical protein